MRKIILIGYGKVGRIHQKYLKKYGGNVIIVDRDKSKIKGEKNAFLDFKEAMKEFKNLEKPFLYDICTDTSQHFPVFKKIVSKDNNANILIEKPIVNSEKQIKQIQEILKKNPSVHVFVNENYLFSKILKRTLEEMKKNSFKRYDIYIEFSKNRIPDMKKGRFVDKKLNALGIEGPHIISMLFELYPGEKPILCSKENNALSSNIVYLTKQKNRICLNTSLNGKINRKNAFSKSNIDKYRIMTVIDKSGKAIVAQFPYNNSLVGKVTTFNKGVILKQFKILDNTMEESIKNAILYFSSKPKKHHFTYEKGVSAVKAIIKK